MNRRLFPTLLVALGLVVAGPAAAPAAKTNVAVGIGDQSPKMFADANWKALKLKKTRYFVEWNAIDQPGEIANADAFVVAANARQRQGAHAHLDRRHQHRPAQPLPSLASYKTKVKALVDRYKTVGVTDWGVWNEANHKSQPTEKNPKRAAQYYKAMKGFCKGCKIVALDVLDQAGVEGYIARWLKAAGLGGQEREDHRHPQLLAGQPPHHGEEGRATATPAPRGSSRPCARRTRRRSSGTRRRAASRASARRSPATGRASRAGRSSCSTMIKTYDKDVERLYSYNWFGTDPRCAASTPASSTPTARRAPRTPTFKSGLKNAKR